MRHAPRRLAARKTASIDRGFQATLYRKIWRPITDFPSGSRRHGGAAVVMAVQPLQQKYDFCGYQAPIIQFQVPATYSNDTQELAQAAVYKIIDFSEPNDTLIQWEGQFTIEESGSLSALRFISKNVLAVLMKKSSTIDWLSHYMVLPLPEPVKVTAGDIVHVSFAYHAGGSVESLQNAIRVTVKPAARVRARHLSLVVG